MHFCSLFHATQQTLCSSFLSRARGCEVEGRGSLLNRWRSEACRTLLGAPTSSLPEFFPCGPWTSQTPFRRTRKLGLSLPWSFTFQSLLAFPFFPFQQLRWCGHVVPGDFLIILHRPRCTELNITMACVRLLPGAVLLSGMCLCSQWAQGQGPVR